MNFTDFEGNIWHFFLVPNESVLSLLVIKLNYHLLAITLFSQTDHGFVKENSNNFKHNNFLKFYRNLWPT